MWIGIAGGHTKTFLLAYSAGECAHFEWAPDQSLNLHCLEKKDLISTLKALLPRALAVSKQRQFQPGDRLVVSFPGISTGADLSLATDCMLGAGWPAELSDACFGVDDTGAGLVAGIQSTEGICAFAGTGASVFVGEGGPLAIGKPYKLDGWGPMIGDFGSGFRLAMTTLEKICVLIDDPTDLPDLLAQIPILERILVDDGITSPKDVQRWFDTLLANEGNKWRLRIAKLAAVVTEAAANGDDFAKQRVHNSASELIRTVRIALRRFPQVEGKPITCQGGMFRHSDLYFNEVKSRIEGNYPSPVERARYHPVVGALLMAASDDCTVPSERGVEQILNAVEALDASAREKIVFS